jgi:hypothetical protein
VRSQFSKSFEIVEQKTLAGSLSKNILFRSVEQQNWRFTDFVIEEYARTCF